MLYSLTTVFNDLTLSLLHVFNLMLDMDLASTTPNYSSHLMLQFGALVFLLSLVALAAPNFFGLYGAFILTIIPLALA